MTHSALCRSSISVNIDDSDHVEDVIESTSDRIEADEEAGRGSSGSSGSINSPPGEPNSHTRASISPPRPKRPSAGQTDQGESTTSFISDLASLDHPLIVSDSVSPSLGPPSPTPPRASSQSHSPTTAAAAHVPWEPSPTPGVSDSASRRKTTPSKALSPSGASGSRPDDPATPAAQTDPNMEWTVPEIAEQLTQFRQDVGNDHSKLVSYIIESTTVTDRRVHSGPDLFAKFKSRPVAEKEGSTMKIKLKVWPASVPNGGKRRGSRGAKQHVKGKKDLKVEHHEVVCIQTDQERVPRYRFHHVGIKKNVLSPNTMLTFVPHLRDLESSEETKYNLWLQELEDIDLKSGFKPMNRLEKQIMTFRRERAATLSLYLDTWLDNLALPGCDKSALIKYVMRGEADTALTPRQKTGLATSLAASDGPSAGAKSMLQMFVDAFKLVFSDGQPPEKSVDLRNILKLLPSADSVIDAKPTAKDGAAAPKDDEDELAESNLATYCILGCLICFSHSCDHGEYDNKNLKRTFSISSCSHLSDALKRRRARSGAGDVDDALLPRCERRCHRNLFIPIEHEQDPAIAGAVVPCRPWLEDEEIVLRSLVTTATHSTYKGDPICLAANFLDRPCRETYRKFQSLNMSLPPLPQLEPPRVKNLSWYDRRKKMLLGDWQEHTVSHEHQRRETLEPCSHPGPCLPRVCSCVDAGLLCDKFCGCTVEECAYKFTGCACHSQGRTCHQKQKDRPCICVQLNRECDPQLCGSCGALERADALNAEDEELHATGCQNCDLQRGLGKSLVLGQSQLEGVGYGLFTAEDISQDDFIIEYVGELITHDEGVRREARRGDVFDQHSNISYVFTLLEHEGIWVDAAIYGNLSRYINHASESDKNGCNITPRILYVNGEYRIKFTAMRDIQAGEELFFNYGENFPNLTKKLLDNKAGEQPRAKTKPRRSQVGDQVARKAPKSQSVDSKRARGRPKKLLTAGAGAPAAAAVTATGATPQHDRAYAVETPGSNRKKRKNRADEEEAGGAAQDQSRIEEAEALNPTPAARNGSSASGKKETEAEVVTRLRMRRGATVTLQSLETSMPPKKKGKRGGARPGSGRPRKHPRPVPKDEAKASPAGKTQASGEAQGVAVGTPSSAAPAAETPRPAATATATATATAIATTSAPATAPAPATTSTTTTTTTTTASLAIKMEVDEIQDSDDGMTSGGILDAAMPLVSPGDYAMTDGVEDPAGGGGGGDDEDEDQDVVVRSRRDRGGRVRRPAAKLRDENIF